MTQAAEQARDLGVPAGTPIDGVLFDLDGVVYHGPDAIPGAVDGIADLHERGIPVGYVTNNATRTADETFSKPHPAMLHELMQELDVAPERVVMIGDTSHDLQMAANAGVHGLGVTYGAHTLKELEGCGPQAVLDSVPGVREWLLARTAAAQ